MPESSKGHPLNTTPVSSASGRLVTLFGGGGYIGPVVAKRLLSAGYRVRVVDMFLYGTENILLGLFDNPGFEVLNGDLADPAVVDAALEGATDTVILAVGLEANDAGVENLRSAGVPVHVIGDATGVGYLEGAIHDGFHAAVSL